MPSRSGIERALAAPTERGGRNLTEAPAQRGPPVGLAFLHDLVSVRAPDLPCVDLPQRIAPQNVPGVEAGVVDAERRAVKDTRQNPHVLDGAAFEYPAEMNLATARVFASIVRMDEGIELPASDQPSVKSHFVGAIRSGTVAMKLFNEGARCGNGHGRAFRVWRTCHFVGCAAIRRLGKIAIICLNETRFEHPRLGRGLAG